MRTGRKRHTGAIAAAWFATLCLSLAYLSYFHADLLEGEWMDVRGFTRIVIPDTFVYAGLIDEEFSPLGFAVAGVKNALVPALMWWATDSSWYAVTLINSLCLLWSLIYVAKLCERFNLRGQRARFIVLTVGLMPVMTYYSTGALKEIPSLLAVTGFFFHYLAGNTRRWMAFAVALFLFRYQMAVIVTAFIVINRYCERPVRVSVLLVLAASAAYPIISSLAVFSSETTALFREEAAGSGSAIEAMRDNVPILAAVAVLIRVGQTVLEPLVTLAGMGSFSEGESVSILAVVYSLSLLPVLPSWWRATGRVRRYFRRKLRRDWAALFSLLVLFVVPVGGFSFVHHRYLFPVTALVLIAGVRPRRRRRPVLDQVTCDAARPMLTTDPPSAAPSAVEGEPHRGPLAAPVSARAST